MIQGKIGYFGLNNWWLSEFSDFEREHILKTYKPLSIGIFESLIDGKISQTSESELSFLTNLCSWFHKSDDSLIAFKIIDKAESFVSPQSNIIDLHFFYLGKLELYYKNRSNRADALNITIETCEKQISIAEKVSSALKKQYKNATLPRHKGFEQLSIIYEKEGKFEKAITLCEKALRQNWKGDWQKRIDRCVIKMSNK